MRLNSAYLRLAALALLVTLLGAAASRAVIMKLTPLGEVVASEKYIFVADVEKLDPERPAAFFKLDRKLKGEPPFDRLAVNMTGDDEAKKANDTKTILERLEGRKVVFFVSRRNKAYEAMAFTEGSWFSLHGTTDADGKTVRWAFLHGEPFLRRTFKGTTAEMVKVIEDALAKKAKPPAPDEKEKPGYGPPASKKCGLRNSDCGLEAMRIARSATSEGVPSSIPQSEFRNPQSALFAVIPSFVLVGPLALVAALFPGVFARMAVGMKRWRAFLVVASVNSTLALVYWAVRNYLPNWVPDSRWLGPRAFTVLLLGVTAVGLWWAGRRYRRMAGEEPAVTATPGRTELSALAGLTAFAALCVVLTAAFADWNTTLELPMREFTFIGIALAVATLYAGYRKLTRSADASNGAEPPLRLSLSGETVGLGTLFLCGLCAVLLMGSRSNAPAFVASTATGDADTVIGPRFVEGSAVAVEAYELDEGEKSKHFGQVMSGLVVGGDRLYFGVSRAGLPGGAVACLNPATGQTHWFYSGSPKLKPVYCTPTIADGKLYCGEGLHTDSDCRVYCLNAADGNPLWKEPFRTASHTEGTPAVVGGKVFFPAGDDGVYCADAASGAKLWQFPGGKDRGIHIDAPPAVSNGTVFVGSGLYSFVAVALDANTGNEKWRANLKHRAFGPPLVRGDRVFYAVGTGNMGADTYHYDEEGGEREKTPAGAVVCLEAATGKERWRYDLPKSVHTGLAADPFTLYAGSRDGCVYAIDRETGKLRWKTAIGTAITSCPAVATAGGYPVAIYAVSREGLVVCLNPQTGAAAWQKQLPGYAWNGQNDVISGPVVVTTPTPTGSRRTIYIGGSVMSESGLPVVTVFRFEDELGE